MIGQVITIFDGDGKHMRKITSQFFYDGVRMYRTEDIHTGEFRNYGADVIDKMYSRPKLKIKPKRYRGPNPSKYYFGDDD